MVHRRADASSKDDSTIVDSAFHGGDDDKNIKLATVRRFGSVLGFLLFVGLFVLRVASSGTKGGNSYTTSSNSLASVVSPPTKIQKLSTTTKDGSPPPPTSNYPNLEAAFAKYENCKVNWEPPPPKTTWDTKPLWLSSFPGAGSNSPSGKGDVMKPLITAITGMKAGAKFYHASSKSLRRCKGVDETATCSNGHPVVEIGPENQKENFYHSIILVIRNYKSCFPVFQSDKAEAYHGAKGQMTVQEWRQSRDMWYKNVLEGWINFIRTWKTMKEYDIGAYIQYEELMDPQRGPQAVQRMAHVLQSAGFPVAPDDDLPCLWFQVVKEEYLRLQTYWQHTPGYTEEQKTIVLQEMKKYQEEIADDKALSAILQEYYDDIKDNTFTDIPYQEEEKADEEKEKGSA